MKTWLSALMFLLVILVVCTARAQDSESLGDVARKNRSEKKEQSKIVVSDQTLPDAPTAQPADQSLCGPPLPLMRTMYAAALLGQKMPPEEELATELLGWLNVHPDLQKMDPEELAKADEPRTAALVQADQDIANRIAQSFTDEMIQYKETHTDEEVQDKLARLMAAKLPARQGDVLDSAVRDEKRRRAALTDAPSDKDRLEEAVNLYAICENKRLIASQGEVDRMTKEALKAKLAAAGFTVEQPAEEPTGN